MIVWSGRGHYIIVLFWILDFGYDYFLGDFGGAIMKIIFSLFFTGIFSLYFGYKWNSKKKITIEGFESENKTKPKKHILLWLKLQYWGYILIVVALAMFFFDSFWVIDKFIQGMGFYIFGMVILSVILTLWNSIKKGNTPIKDIKKKEVDTISKTTNLTALKTRDKTVWKFKKSKKVLEEERLAKEKMEEMARLEKEAKLKIKQEKEDPSRFMPK